MSRLQHKKGRKSNYVKTLGSEYDKEVRRRVLLRDGFQCKYKGCFSKIFLEKHHISYYVNGESIIGKELEGDNLKWLVTLCDYHHTQVHADPLHKWNPKNRNREHI